MNESADFEPDRLRNLLRDASDQAGPGADCPAPDRIWAAVHLELPVDERLEILDHVADCPACAEAWRLAVECARAEPAAAQPRPWVWWSRATMLRAAAVILVVTGVAIAWRSVGRAPDPSEREPPAQALTPQFDTRLPLPRDDFRLRWTPAADGARYELVVTDPGLGVVVVTEPGIDRPEYRIPADRLSTFPAGTRLLWRVVADLPEGGRLSSETYEAILR